MVPCLSASESVMDRAPAPDRRTCTAGAAASPCAGCQHGRNRRMTDAAPVVVEQDGAVGVIRLNRPDKFNCLSTDVMRHIAAAMDRFEADAGIRAVLVMAEGRQFCTGADLDEVQVLRADRTALAQFIATGHATLCRLEAS